jgi:nitroreductase
MKQKQALNGGVNKINMDALDLIRSRRSIREYKKELVAKYLKLDEDLELVAVIT